MSLNRAIFWPTFIAAGFTRRAKIGKNIVHVIYRAPTELLFGGRQQSNEHTIYYQDADLPNLAEGDSVVFVDEDGAKIKGQTYKVRRAPWTSDIPGTDQSGYFKYAALTKD